MSNVSMFKALAPGSESPAPGWDPRSCRLKPANREVRIARYLLFAAWAGVGSARPPQCCYVLVVEEAYPKMTVPPPPPPEASGDNSKGWEEATVTSHVHVRVRAVFSRPLKHTFWEQVALD